MQSYTLLDAELLGHIILELDVFMWNWMFFMKSRLMLEATW